MIDYQTCHQIHHLHAQERLTTAPIARQLDLHCQTVAKWLARPEYERRPQPKRPRKLEPFKSTGARLLAQHPFTAQQLFQRLRAAGYAGGYAILTDYVRHVRPAPGPAFLTLHFAPGQCAQVDWGSAGWLRVAATRRRLSFLVMVLCYSRRMQVEFTLAQTQAHFLACHQHACEYFGGVSAEVMVDNCKTAVLAHPFGQPALLHPRLRDFAQHYGFTIKACGARQPHEKGRVEKATT